MNAIKLTPVICFLMLLSFWPSIVKAQQKLSTLDSTLTDRITALEEKVAQQKSGEDHFMVVGLTTFGFVNTQTITTVNGISSTLNSNSLADAAHFEFSPMLLWRHGKKMLLEFEPSFNNNGLSVNWADISYFVTPGLIVRGGYLVIPFGIYNKRLAAGWINKLATDPIGLNVPASADYGVEIEGGLPLGDMKWNYDLALTNGMRLMPDGQLQSVGIIDNNLNKTFSGRLGLFPFSNSSLEIGASALSGIVGDANSRFQNARTNMAAVDLNYVKLLNPFLVNIKGQFNMISINRQNYANPNDSTQSYSYNNKSTSGFAMVAVRPVSIKNVILRNFELAFRYANNTTPVNSTWGLRSNQITIGLDYWINWRTVLKLTHENSFGTSMNNLLFGIDEGSTKSSAWYLQFSIQL
jgi:hypothetical protein